jgi:hypothetical protein
VRPRPLRGRLNERLPEILIEAASVVIALLLAVGANAWHEHSRQVSLSHHARAAIRAEIASNRSRLQATRASIKTALKKTRAALSSRDRNDQKQFALPYRPLLPSAAAWQIARDAGAIRAFNYKQMLKLAGTYELQDMFMRAQRRVLYPPAPVSVPGMQKPGSRGHKMYVKLQLAQYLINVQRLSGLGAQLDQAYRAALDDGEPGQ